MKASHEHQQLLSVVEWADRNTIEIGLPTGERDLIVIGCFDAAIEYAAAVAALHGLQLYGAALALFRSVVEAVVRGLWLQHCATESGLRKFKADKLKKEFRELVDEVEAKLEMQGSALSNFKGKTWRAMNGFTHTGFQQIVRRHAPGRVEEQYEEAELAQALNSTGAMALLAASQLIALSGNSARLEAVAQRMQQYSASAGAD
jgi:hypothetical protein